MSCKVPRKGKRVAPRLGGVLLALALVAAGGGRPGASEAVTVELFSPQGTARVVRQVTARFSAPMVPLGDPHAGAAPFVIDCSETGAGRWVDSRTWAYDFERDVPGGVRCLFTLRDNLRALSGAPVTAEKSFTFSTGGPAIIASIPSAGDEGIDEEQAFVVQTNALPTESSLLDHAAFAIDGIAESVGVSIVSGTAREQILSTLPPDWNKETVLVLQSKQRFPSDAHVRLVWDRGIAAASGVATEQPQVLEFKTRAPFTAAIECQRETSRAGCIPLTPVRVRFSAPVSWAQAKAMRLTAASGKEWAPAPPESPEESVYAVEFAPPFPERSTLHVQLAAALEDLSGRTLANTADFPLQVETAAVPPLAKFSSRFGIVEWKADPVLPVTLRDVGRPLPHPSPAPAGASTGLRGRILRVPDGQIWRWLRRVAAARRVASVFGPRPEATVRSFVLPKPSGAAAFEVVGIPFQAPGLYVVELQSPNLGAALLDRSQSLYVPTAALVTNLSVHLEWGRESSVVWVTTLDGGAPVADAAVEIRDCRGTVLWSGHTDAQGIARVADLPAEAKLQRCDDSSLYSKADEIDYRDFAQTPALSSLSGGLLVTAESGGDLGFVHSSWTRGIEPWRFQLPEDDYRGPTVAHTIFDRPLFRAGETVHMKHILRAQTLSGFDLPPRSQWPTSLRIRHEGSGDKYDLPLEWDAAGTAVNEWPIPKAAKLGQYRVELIEQRGEHGSLQHDSGSFRVEEYRVPLMKAAVRLPAEPQVAVTAVPADLSVRYLAGGGAGGLEVVLRSQIRDKSFSPPLGFERYTFANGEVTPGVVRRGAAFAEPGEESKPTPIGVHQRQQITLDEAGAARAAISDLPQAPRLRVLLAEMEFRDANGERQTVAATVPLWPARWIVGIDPDRWVHDADNLTARVAVLDTGGNPVIGAAVEVQVFERKTYSHRTRLIGGFYAYENVEETSTPLGVWCRGQTRANGVLVCEGTAPKRGNLVLQAVVVDGAGNHSATHEDVWVSGEEQWFEEGSSDRIDVLPDKVRYQPGEVAHLQVRMPFRQATALVSIERGGVLESDVRRLSGKDPVLDVPVRPEWSPNVFISVLVVRGRVGEGQPTTLVDLGKPAFKLGVAEIRVGWDIHELQVAVRTERESYRVRDKVPVSVTVRTPDGAPPPAGSEITFAAVDEGLLELLPNASWNLLAAMMGQRGYGVRTATAQMQVVGKRHYGLKALPQGGGGGRQPTRELFDTLLLWRARVPLDASGEAQLEVPLNDSLTAFRLVAVATGGLERFGTGSTTIRSTQDLMLLPGISPFVRQGDDFRAEFTVRNGSGRPMQVHVTGQLAELPDAMPLQSLSLRPGESRIVGWELTAPAGADSLTYHLEASESGGAEDHLQVTQPVEPAVPVQTLQATLRRWEKPLEQQVNAPANALPGRGGVDVDLAPTLLGGLQGVRGWMRHYAYTCLEQRVSRAVALGDAEMWTSITASLPAYLDADGLLKYFPAMPHGSEVLTAYVLAIANAAGLDLPADTATAMESGLRKFVQGSIRRGGDIAAADLSIRKLSAIEALARAGKAEPAMLQTLAVEPDLWPTSAILDWWSILERLKSAPQRAARMQQAERILRARLNLQGTTMAFSTSGAGDNLWWLMVCPDTNPLRLVLHLARQNRWRDDLPRLARGALLRQRHGHWDCTVSNAWGVLAMRAFSEAFEKAPVSGTTAASLAGQEKRVDWAEPGESRTLSFAWPEAPATLRVDHDGGGTPWVTISTRAAVPLREALASGYRISKTITPIESATPGQLTRGDVLRVHLEIDAQSEMTWVVVDDPIPAGAAHVGGGLARDSRIAAEGEQQQGAIPAFAERAAAAYRAYYDFVPQGRFTVEYTIRLNQSGRFQLPPTRVEALYAPEMFGERPNEPMEVKR